MFSLDDEPIAPLSKQQLKTTKTRIYDLTKVKKSKKWLKNVLLDKSDSSEDEEDLNEDQLVKEMLRLHKLQMRARNEWRNDQSLRHYQNYSAGLVGDQIRATNTVSVADKTPIRKSRPKKRKVTKIEAVEPSVTPVLTKTVDTMTTHSVSELLPAVEMALKTMKTEKVTDEIAYDPQLPKDILQTECSEPESSNWLPAAITPLLPEEIFDTEESSGSVLSQTLSQPTPTRPLTTLPAPKCATAPATPTSLSPATSPLIPTKTVKRSAKKTTTTTVSADTKRKRLWVAIARKEIPRAHKQKVLAKREALTQAKRLANWCQRERRKQALNHQKQLCRDQSARARRLSREMLVYWKRYERTAQDIRKKAEKEAQEQLKLDQELLEAKRQQRKLNLLITQTELYAHFLSGKTSSDEKDILGRLEEEPLSLMSGIKDDYDLEFHKQEALRTVETALEARKKGQSSFPADKGLDLSQVVVSDGFACPRIFLGALKPYQEKGVNWLLALYSRQINGILCDEMGLGKTVQTIAFLATLAERLGVWGPFLVVAPASTLHNWQQEFQR